VSTIGERINGLGFTNPFGTTEKYLPTNYQLYMDLAKEKTIPFSDYILWPLTD